MKPFLQDGDEHVEPRGLSLHGPGAAVPFETNDGWKRPREAAVSTDEVPYRAASFSFFSGRTLSFTVAGLALNTCSSFVKGLIPLRAFFAGT